MRPHFLGFRFIAIYPSIAIHIATADTILLCKRMLIHSQRGLPILALATVMFTLSVHSGSKAQVSVSYIRRYTPNFQTCDT